MVERTERRAPASDVPSTSARPAPNGPYLARAQWAVARRHCHECCGDPSYKYGSKSRGALGWVGVHLLRLWLRLPGRWGDLKADYSGGIQEHASIKPVDKLCKPRRNGLSKHLCKACCVRYKSHRVLDYRTYRHARRLERANRTTKSVAAAQSSPRSHYRGEQLGTSGVHELLISL